MTASMKTIAQTVFRLVVTVTCLWLLMRSIDTSRLLATFRNVQPGWVVTTLLVYWTAQVVSSLRCAYIARHLGGSLSMSTALRAHFVGLWFNQVLPSGLGGDLVKVAIMRQPLGLGLAVRAGILDRLSGLVFLVVAVTVTLPLYRDVLDEVLWLGLATVAAGFFVALVMAVFIAHAITAKLALPPWLATLFQTLKDVWQFRRGQAFWQQVWTSAIVHANGITTYLLISVALGFTTHALHYMLLVPLVFLLALLPLSLAGWGVREAGAVWLFGLVGIPGEQAMAISIGYGLLLIIASMPGLVVFLLGKQRQPAGG